MSVGASELQDFVGFLVRSFVESPDEVEVEAFEEDRQYIVEVSVDTDDLRLVIGRGGRTAMALRTVLDAYAYKNRIRARLEILEDEDEDEAADVEDDAEDTRQRSNEDRG